MIFSNLVLFFFSTQLVPDIAVAAIVNTPQMFPMSVA